MRTYDLSILIPARNEEFVSNTVADIIKNKRGRTEVIVGLDGAWAEPGIIDHPDVRIVYVSESIGQRAMTNKLARLSRAKYVAKCDAHCAFDEGFDVKLMGAMADDITIVPVMRNLHVFDWVCQNCGMREYQGPKPEQCRNEMCANEPQRFEKDIVWYAKPNPQSSAYRFNKNLQFKYFPELRNKQPKTGLAETMSLQGSFFMLTREKYWSLNICDESWGSWGQQGTEVALKTWLSGGRVMCLRDTWYAHLFRTQHGFSFPYPMSGRDQDRARKISRDLFLNDKWEQQVRPLTWLLNRFWFALKEVQDPEARWEAEDITRLTPSRCNIIYYTDNQLPLRVAHRVQRQLRKIAAERNLPIVSASLKPMDNMGMNIWVKGERGTVSYFRQIVAALEASKAEYVYFCEHDVLYHPSHFDFTPPTRDKFYYNHNVWRLRTSDGFAVTWDANQVAQLCCARELALNYYREKLAAVTAGNFDRRYEPGGRDSTQFGTWRSAFPNIDIRGDWNLTKSKWSPRDFRDTSTCINWQESRYDSIPGWEPAVLKRLCQ